MNDALKNLMTRRSCRAYDPAQIKPEELDAILQAGVYAPTGKGKQSPLVVAIQTPETLAKVEALNAAVMGKPDAHPFYGAPTAVVVFYEADNPLSVADANLIMGNLMNAANAVGVASCYIWRAKETFESDEGKALKAAWGIPDNYVAAGNVILGYGKPEGYRELAPRKADYIRKV